MPARHSSPLPLAFGLFCLLPILLFLLSCCQSTVLASDVSSTNFLQLLSPNIHSSHKHHQDNTSGDNDYEPSATPLRIPKLSRAEKRQLILNHFRREGKKPPRELFGPEWTGGGRRRKKIRRELANPAIAADKPWRRLYLVRRQYRPRMTRTLTARNTQPCPNRLDAVTEAFNKRLYLFAGEMAYEVWRDQQGLQQRQAFHVHELFPDGPRRVTVALSNRKSGVTLLLEHRNVYRYRWNRRHKRFYLARNCPRQLPAQVEFVPHIGFQWKDGHLILADKTNFVAYDPYWNVVTFSNQTAKYFPDLAFDRLAGVVKQSRESTLWLNNEGRVQLYNMEKQWMGLELPLNLPKLLACLPHQSSMPAAVNNTSIAGGSHSSSRR